MYTGCTTENILDLRRAESIRGIPISNSDINFLENYCKEKQILKVQCGCCHELSKPKSFFINKPEFTFLKDGKEKQFWEVDVDNQEFIAFQISSKKVLSVYGYFRYECD